MWRGTLLVVSIALVCATPAAAATLTVSTNADAGTGSLRGAIDAANAQPGADVIRFDEGLDQTLALRSRLPTITSALSIEGPGASLLTLYGADRTGILDISMDRVERVRVAGLSLRGGMASGGGAISSFGADLELDRVVVSENRATNSGGAINVSEGSLTLRDSRLRGNSAEYAGGALQLYDAAMTVQHSEISGSSAGGSGGGIHVESPFGAVAVERSRITGNSATGNGGGISVSDAPVQPLTIVRTEVSGNDASGDGGGVARTQSAQPVLIATKLESNESEGRGPDVYPALLDQLEPPPAPQPAQAPAAPPAAPASAGGGPEKALDGPMPSATGGDDGPSGNVSAATLLGGVAFAPPDAPDRVKAVIDAANFISRTPYVYGGGHGSFYSRGYDCSGAVSFALYGGGFLDSPLDSSSFMNWGEPGPGRWITIYTNPGHAFAVIAGRRWDTSGNERGSGPRWHLDIPGVGSFVARHPADY